MTAGEAALLAMVVNLGAYSTEIVRAGIRGDAERPVGGRTRARAQPDANIRSRGAAPRRCSGFIRRWLASASS